MPQHDKKKILSLDDLEKFFYENQEDIENNANYTKAVNEGRVRPNNIIETMASFVNDIHVEGYVLKYPHGTVIRQAERRNYYRGEAEDYPTSKTTLYRELDECHSDDQKMVIKLIAKMRIIEFRDFLKRLKYVRAWEETYGDPFYEAIAQHYGFMTEYLDITNDFNVAMFFACCMWDTHKRAWRPLTDEECKAKKYGVLYHARSDRIMLAFEDYKNLSPKVVPIGYQPFYRCQKQVGYVKHMDEGEDFKESMLFERLYFEHSTNLSEGVFHYMNKGLDIYPDESLMFFEKEIEDMKSLLQFDFSTFDRALAELGLSDKKDEMTQLLQASNFATKSHTYKDIVIGDGIKVIRIPRQKINRFNLKNEFRSPEKDNNIQLTTRWIYAK